MTFEQHARTQLGYQSDFELQRFTNGNGINDPALADSPLPDPVLQDLAEEEQAAREQEYLPLLVEELEDQDDLDDL